MSEQRPAFQRLLLREPLDGWFSDFPVRLVDVSASGAQVEHDETIPEDARGLLRFHWLGRDVEILAMTARVIQPDRSGLHFLEDNETLRSLLGVTAAEVLRALEANAHGNRGANVIGDETLTSAWLRPIGGYVVWSWDGHRWSAEPSESAAQPDDGFTISAAESEDQVEMLRQTYQHGDAEARRLTRMFAEMSVNPAS